MSIAIADRPVESLPSGSLRLTHDVIASARLLTAHGELDARTARTLVNVVDGLASDDHDALIVDLGGLAFFGTEGLWALNRIKAACAKHGVTAAIVAGPEVERVLRICDPYGALGVVATVDHAVSIVLDRSSASSR